MRLNIKLLRSSRIFPCNPTRLSSLLGTPDRSFMKPGGPVRTMEWTPMRTYNVDLLLGVVLGVVLTLALGWGIAQLLQS
jgi:hypothetical protein